MGKWCVCGGVRVQLDPLHPPYTHHGRLVAPSLFSVSCLVVFMGYLLSFRLTQVIRICVFWADGSCVQLSYCDGLLGRGGRVVGAVRTSTLLRETQVCHPP